MTQPSLFSVDEKKCLVTKTTKKKTNPETQATLDMRHRTNTNKT